jgi:hypothetical protein
MRNRLVLIALPLCAVMMLAAGAAAASPNGGEHFNDTKLDDPHEVRPIAAASSLGGAHALDVIYLERVDAAAAATTLATPPPPPPAPEPEPEPAPQPAAPAWSPSSTAPSGGGDFLSCVRNRESGGDYSIHNTGGSGASGAYQFMPGTWNSIASSSGRADLVGVDPAAASPADQDAMAQALYSQQGSAPWGGYCG